MTRIIALVDMDCFYVQVEQRRNPNLKGKPCAVVQYNQWKGGGIIAVSYEARAHGVTRQMRGDEAKKKCPDMLLVSVPVNREKADLTRYREAGAEVINVLTQFSKQVERASVDEAYIDLTEEVKVRLHKMRSEGVKVTLDELPCTYIAGRDGKDKDQEGKEEASEGQTKMSDEDIRRIGTGGWLEGLPDDEADHDLQLSVGALIVEEMRAAVLKQTGFNCSAGISHNKSLAKLSCGLHKPRKQTVCPQASVTILYQTIPLHKVRNLGGKLGASLVEGLKVKTIGDLCRYSEKELQAYCGDKTGAWLFGYCRGVDDEPVKPRNLPKSVGCSKNFTGKAALDSKDKVKYWLQQLSEEITERLQKEKDNNNRIAKSLGLYIRQDGTPPQSCSRTCGLFRINADQIASDAFKVIQSLNVAGNHQAAWSPAIICLGISASKFIDASKGESACLDNFLRSKPAAKKSEASATVSRPEEYTQQSQIDKPKAKTNKRNSLDFFLSQSQSVTMTQNYNDDESLTKQVGGQKETPKRNSLDHFFAASQRTQDKSSAVTQKDEFDLTKSECSSDEDVKQSASSTSNSIMNMVRPGVSRLTGRGFFATKLKGNSPETQMKSNVSHINKDQGNATESHTKLEASYIDKEHNAFDATDINEPREIETDVESHDNLDNYPSTSIPPSNKCESDQPVPSTSVTLTSNGCESDKSVLSDDEVQCEKCKQIISVWEYPEHLDYHFALQIQNETNMIPSVDLSKNSSTVSGTPKGKLSGKRRGRPPGPSSSKKAKIDSGSLLSIQSFFKPK